MLTLLHVWVSLLLGYEPLCILKGIFTGRTLYMQLLNWSLFDTKSPPPIILITTVLLDTSPFKMSNHKPDSSVRLAYTNWNLWDCYVKSTIHWKNAYIAFNLKPVNLSTPQQVMQAVTVGTMATPAIAVTLQPTAEDMKMYSTVRNWKSGGQQTMLQPGWSSVWSLRKWSTLLILKIQQRICTTCFQRKKWPFMNQFFESL